MPDDEIKTALRVVLNELIGLNNQILRLESVTQATMEAVQMIDPSFEEKYKVALANEPSERTRDSALHRISKIQQTLQVLQ